MKVLDAIGGVLILGGALLTLLAAVGLHRFPDVFARMHAATKPATLGLVTLLTGAILITERAAVALKFGLVAGLAFITAPVASHMIGRAAYRAGSQIGPDTVLDELAERRDRARPDGSVQRGGASGLAGDGGSASAPTEPRP